MRLQTFHIDDFIGPDEHFHFARKALSVSKPKFLHRHDFYEVFIVTHGATHHWIGNDVTRLDRGHLVFVRPGEQHALQAARGERNEIVNVALRPEIIEHIGERYGPDLGQRFFWHEGSSPDVYPLTGPRFERAVNVSSELQASGNSLAAIEGYLLTLFTRVVDLPISDDDSVPQWLIAASDAAKRPEVFREGAAGFVRAAGRGHEHVCRMARKHLGMSPSTYVNRIRMQHAALMLAGSDRAIQDISADCGIENLSYFYRVFQRQYGTTPRQYRVNHQKNPMRAS